MPIDFARIAHDDAQIAALLLQFAGVKQAVDADTITLSEGEQVTGSLDLETMQLTVTCRAVVTVLPVVGP